MLMRYFPFLPRWIAWLCVLVMSGSTLTWAGESHARELSGGGLGVNVKSFGALGDAKTDDTAAIQAALDSLKDGGVLFFPPGEYRVTDTLRIRQDHTSLIGTGSGTCRIRYVGEKFVDVIEIRAFNGVKIRNLSIYGGFYTEGNARYCIFAKRFHRDCEITGCQIREGVGLVRIEAGYYCRILDNQIRNATPSRTDAGITHEQWLEVHGPDSAPVYLRGMNTTSVDRNKFTRLGSVSGTSRTRQAIWVSGTATSMDNSSIEAVFPWSDKGKKHDSSTQTLIRFENWIGSVDNLYLEAIHATGAMFEVHGDKSQVAMRNGGFYRVVCDTLIHNASANAVVFDDAYAYRIMAGRLASVDSPQRSVTFRNCSVMPGDRFTDPSVNAHKENLYDTRGTAWPLGIDDGDLPVKRRVFPRVLSGLSVSPGLDEHGSYVEVTCGVFLRESGERVSLQRRAGGSTLEGDAEEGTDVPVVVRLRPVQPNVHYRLFIGRAGQPYLRTYPRQPTDPTGNWIVEFAADEQGAVGKFARNPRLDLRGEYVGGTSTCRALAEDLPDRGYWLRGDRIENLSPQPAGPVGWVCTRTGLAGSDAEFLPCEACLPPERKARP